VAEKRAALIYAREVHRAPEQPRPARPRPGSGDLVRQGALWLTSLHGSLDEGTIGTIGVYLRAHLLQFFEAVDGITTARCAEYMATRLGVVTASTVRKELSALRQWVAWMRARQIITWPVDVPSVPKRALGTRYEKRRRVAAPRLSREEIEAFLAAIPAKTRHGHKTRARFRLQYEADLRPTTLARLSVPEHWVRGSRWLSITPEIDKTRLVRRVPLTDAAVRALEEAAPERGIIFGRVRHTRVVAEAAAATLPPEKAAVFCAAHLRSARATHLLEAGAKLPGVQALMGHRSIATTARYVRASEEAALEALEADKPKR